MSCFCGAGLRNFARLGNPLPRPGDRTAFGAVNGDIEWTSRRPCGIRIAAVNPNAATGWEHSLRFRVGNNMKFRDTAAAAAATVHARPWSKTPALGSLFCSLFAGISLLGASAHAAVSPTKGISAQVQPRSTLQYYSDESLFTAALGVPANLTVETFDNGQPLGYPMTCPGPFSSTTNNNCFHPGNLAPGFELSAFPGSPVAYFPQNYNALPSRAVGAGNYVDMTNIAFSPAVSAMAATIYGGSLSGTYTVDISIYDVSDALIDSTSIQATSPHEGNPFFGVISPTPIGRITINSHNSSTDSEIIDNLKFRPANLAPPGLGLAFSPSQIAAGNASTLTITLGNQAQPGVATLAVPLVDTLPSGVTLATPANAATTCAAGTVNASGSTITLPSGAQIPGSGICTVTVNVTATQAGLYIDTIAAGALQTDLGNSRDAASAPLTVSTGATGTFPPEENFDEVFAPALPAGWISSMTGGGKDFTTETGTIDAGLNAVTVDDRGVVSDMTLTSPAFTPVDRQTVTFRHSFNLERGFDGAVLEISIDGGAFSDIVTAGGQFLTGGYAGIKLSPYTGNPLGGHPAWTGNSFGFVTTTAQLPAAATGHSVKLRFRSTDDSSNLNTGEIRGWWIDSIMLGVPVQAPTASFTPASLDFSVDEGATATLPLTLSNAAGSDPLTFAIESRSEAGRPQLIPYGSIDNAKTTAASVDKPLVPRPLATLSSISTGASHQARSLPWAPADSLLLEVDDGSAESALGTGPGSINPPVPFSEQAAVWMNRFQASDAMTIHSISIFWPEPSMSGGDLIGLQANLVVYYDASSSGNLANAVRVGTDKLVPITATGDFVSYPTDFSIPAAGDVYIGFVDEWAINGGFTPRRYPAAIDTSLPSQNSSYFSSVDTPPVDIVHLGNNTYNNFFNDANLMIRAAATGGGTGGPCSGPIVNWLSATPTGTTINGGDNAIVAVKVDAAAGNLAEGNYHAELCISSNDPNQLLFAVPVSVTVGNPPPVPCSSNDEIFCDGFDHPGPIVSGLVDQDVANNGDGSAFNFVSGDYHPYNPSMTDDDVNLYAVGNGNLAVYWYGDFVPPTFQAAGIADENGQLKVMQSGDTVGPASPIVGSTVMNNWLGGADGYIGVIFYNETTAAINYGYLHVTTTAPGGFPAHVLDWAYDSSGAAITIP